MADQQVKNGIPRSEMKISRKTRQDRKGKPNFELLTVWK
jgi:hypothetical protein